MSGLDEGGRAKLCAVFNELAAKADSLPMTRREAKFQENMDALDKLPAKKKKAAVKKQVVDTPVSQHRHDAYETFRKAGKSENLDDRTFSRVLEALLANKDTQELYGGHVFESDLIHDLKLGLGIEKVTKPSLVNRHPD